MISCPKCKTTNEDAAKFCSSCGGALTQSMASKATGVVGNQAKKISDSAKQTAETEFQGRMNNMITDMVKNIMSKIFGK